MFALDSAGEGDGLKEYSLTMMLSGYKKYARLVLCAAMLFVVGNTVHAIEHDPLGGYTQSHIECHHCSAEQSAATSIAVVHPVLILPTAKVHSLIAAVPFALTSSFRARAPPLS